VPHILPDNALTAAVGDSAKTSISCGATRKPYQKYSS
jgi:hypothetical protein